MKTDNPGNSKIALALAIVAIVITVVIVIYVIYYIVMIVNDPTFWEEYQALLDEYASQY